MEKFGVGIYIFLPFYRNLPAFFITSCVKNIDIAYLHKILPVLETEKLNGLKYIGVDKVVRTKGHDYMDVVHEPLESHLIWVETGRTAEVFSSFLKQIPVETVEKIGVVDMDMGPAYQKLKRWNIHWSRGVKRAEQIGMTYIRLFAKSLRKYKGSIFNYAIHQLTSARTEAGNVSIGMIRKRARGISDTDYF